VVVDVVNVEVQENVEEDSTLEVLVVVVVLGILLVALVVGMLEEAVVADVVAIELEVGVVVDEEATVDELVEGVEVPVVDEPLERAK